MINLFNMDCMKAMRAMPDKAYSLAICDPPYGIDIETHQEEMKRVTINYGTWKQYKKSGWDKNIPDSSYFDELRRVTHHQIIWGGNYMLDYLGRTKCFIVWDKIQRDNRADAEIAWTSFERPIKVFRYSRVDAYINHCDAKIHSCQKPVKLYEWLLKNYAKPGDRILDTHLGSGSSAIAAYNMGYDFTGFEIDKDYYEAAVKRLEDHKRQGLLFEPKEMCLQRNF